MFFPTIRLLPERAGISPIALGTRHLPFLYRHDVYPPDGLAHPGRVRHMLADELVLEPRFDAVPRRAHLGQVVGGNLPELHDLPRPDELLAAFERRLALHVRAEPARRGR